jgi:hypothetical protein
LHYKLTADLTLLHPPVFTFDGAIYATSISYTLAEVISRANCFCGFGNPPATNTTYGGLINLAQVGLNDLKEQLIRYSM